MTILDQIVAQKRIEIAERMATTPVSALELMPDFKRMPLSARDAVQDSLNGYHRRVQTQVSF